MVTLLKTMHTENQRVISALTDDVREIKADVREVKDEVKATNGRVNKHDVAIAVLKFAVFTIGGALVLAGLQVIVARLSS